ncbi:MAG: GDSL-type esterase/lipase family protein [Planctomycetota bacterium]
MSSAQGSARRFSWLLDLTLVALAVLLTRPAPERVGGAFAVPGALLEVEYAEGAGLASDLQRVAERIEARKELALVFRWLESPAALAVEAPRGGLELSLGPGPAAPTLRLSDTGARLTQGPNVVAEQLWGQSPPRRVALEWSPQGYALTVDASLVGERVAGAPPAGPARLTLQAGASIAALECGTTRGETRRVVAAPAASGWQRTLWAGAVALAGSVSLRLWWSVLRRRRAAARGFKHRPDSETALLGRGAGLIAALVLVVGLPLLLKRQNAERLQPPEPCTQESFRADAPRLVAPGRPYAIGERRDGDFRLEAVVDLHDGAALDLLLRAGLPRIDQQILVGLSAAEEFPAGVGRNLGLFLDFVPAAGDLVRLPTGRPLRLRVECRAEFTEAFVDERALGRVRDLDLRAGRLAFHALSGTATVSELSITPLGQPRALSGWLTRWMGGLVVLLLAGLFTILHWGRCGWGGLTWLWPLAALIFPQAPEELRGGALLVAGLLLAPLAPPGRRCLVWATGLVLLLATACALAERPVAISAEALNALRPVDVTGPALAHEALWARHPLGRRFNPYLRLQDFRDRFVSQQRPPGALRLVTLGSSSTFGYGVKAGETWSAQLERILRQQWPERSVEVVNAGVPGATAERLRSFLDGVLLPLQPDLVIIDLSFNDQSWANRADERAHFAAMSSTGIGPLERWLELWRVQWRLRSFLSYSAELNRGEAPDPRDVERFETEPAGRFGASLRDMIQSCREANVAVLLVQEPRRPGDSLRSLQAFHAAMAAVGEECAVRVVSPQAALDEIGPTSFLDMVHPTAPGHLILARSIAAELLAWPAWLPQARGFR